MDGWDADSIYTYIMLHVEDESSPSHALAETHALAILTGPTPVIVNLG